MDGSILGKSTLYQEWGLQEPMIMFRIMKVPLMMIIIVHIASFIIMRLVKGKGD